MSVSIHKKLVKYAGAEEILGIPRNHIRQMVFRGELPHIRLTKKTVLFDVEELQRFIDERRVAVKGAK